MGQRYGSKLLQPKISSRDFYQFLSKLNADETKLLNEFYELDENSIKDQVYILKPEKELNDEV